jgi:hypothetical protein
MHAVFSLITTTLILSTGYEPELHLNHTQICLFVVSLIGYKFYCSGYKKFYCFIYLAVAVLDAKTQQPHSQGTKVHISLTEAVTHHSRPIQAQKPLHSKTTEVSVTRAHCDKPFLCSIHLEKLT